MFRVLVTGSRTWEIEWPILYEIAFDIPAGATVVEGGAEGLDKTFGRLWSPYGPVEVIPATWNECGWDCLHSTHRKIRNNGDEYCPRAGMRRNQEMVDKGANLFLAFIKNGSPGASGCLEMAIRAGIPIVVWRDSGKGPYRSTN